MVRLIVAFILIYNTIIACGGCGCNLGYGGNLSTMAFQAPSLIGIGHTWQKLFYYSPFLINPTYNIHTFSIYGQYTFKDKYQLLASLPYVIAQKNYNNGKIINSGISDPTIGFQYMNTIPLKEDISIFYSGKITIKPPIGEYDYLNDPIIQPGGGNWETNISLQSELGIKRNSIRINIEGSKFLYNPKTLTQTGNIYKGTLWLARKLNKKNFSAYLLLGANIIKTQDSYYNGYKITGSKMTLVNSLAGSLLLYKRLGMFITYYYPIYQSNLYINATFYNTLTIQLFKLL